jgi:hydrogenase maturation protease
VNETRPSGILIACIGNIFLGDDGFGCEVARSLAQVDLPADVSVIDYGIRGLDLAYALLNPYAAVIFVDIVSRGAAPGTLYLLQPVHADAGALAAPDPHSMDPMHLLAMARSLGEITAEIFIVACEPNDFGDEFEGRMGLSEVVASAIPEAVRTIFDVIAGVRKRESRMTISLCAVA